MRGRASRLGRKKEIRRFADAAAVGIAAVAAAAPRYCGPEVVPTLLAEEEHSLATYSGKCGFRPRFGVSQPPTATRIRAVNLRNFSAAVEASTRVLVRRRRAAARCCESGNPHSQQRRNTLQLEERLGSPGCAAARDAVAEVVLGNFLPPFCGEQPLCMPNHTRHRQCGHADH